MCGIAGVLGPVDNHFAVAEKMACTLNHRGPDDSGVWADADAGIALSHQRLSILDLSSAGHQPMQSPGGRYVLVYNGEIYNHDYIRAEIDAIHHVNWRGHSDTETLLAGFDAWGIKDTLQRCVGMFALALWDRQERVLTLARDRLGEKPLYYGRADGALIFGSELKALRAFPGFNPPVERRALALFLRHNYVPTPWSIYKDVWKLPPGCFMQFRKPSSPGDAQSYWSLHAAAQAGQSGQFDGNDTEAVDELERHLGRSVGGQMVADVPLGAFLSGGIDSSVVVALMQSQSSRPVKTFTIGFHEGQYNEAEHGRAVAQHLETEHTNLYVTPQEAQDVIPRLPDLYDEPFADASQIPTFLVARLARQHVTVALSGDGGDELFGGYSRYFWATALWRRLGHLPLPMRRLIATGMKTASPAVWDTLFHLIRPLVPRAMRFACPGDKMHKLAGVLDAPGREAVYTRLISQWMEPDSLVLGAHEPPAPSTDPSAWLKEFEYEHQMMYLDTMTYLPDDILVKVDRAAMGVSLETRVPMLDHRVLEFAWSLPLTMKIRAGKGKWLLRQLLYRYVPSELIERPKMGFAIPIDQWLRGPLRDWAESLLDESRLHQEGYFDPEPVRQKWREHLSGRRNWQYPLWGVLMFQAWLEGR